jgi:hypothetical protein
VSAVSDHELDTRLLDKEDDDGVDDDIEIDILNEICNDKDDIEDYCDDYIAEEVESILSMTTTQFFPVMVDTNITCHRVVFKEH